MRLEEARRISKVETLKELQEVAQDFASACGALLSQYEKAAAGTSPRIWVTSGDPETERRASAGSRRLDLLASRVEDPVLRQQVNSLGEALTALHCAPEQMEAIVVVLERVAKPTNAIVARAGQLLLDLIRARGS